MKKVILRVCGQRVLITLGIDMSRHITFMVSKDVAERIKKWMEEDSGKG